ncbi:MAG: TrkA family potassium uptake protein [Firmicutes bacterium]|nr:TrkA family potassium uptake protein [Bacillota bacterium]
MKSILLIGLGRFGQHVAMELNERGHQVLAVDQTEERVNAVLAFVTSAQIGDSTSEEFLSSLGIRNFDTCIVAIGDSFQDSLETASLLKELGAKKVIARAASDVQEKFLLRNGADEVVYPEKQLASWMVTRCTSDYILDYIDLEGDSDIYELAIPESWKGKTVLQMDLRKKFGINILGTKQGKIWNMHVGPDTVFGEGESILVLGTQKSVERCFRM